MGSLIISSELALMSAMMKVTANELRQFTARQLAVGHCCPLLEENYSLFYYRKTSSISRTLVGNKIVDNSDVVGASPVGAAPTTSSFST